MIRSESFIYSALSGEMLPATFDADGTVTVHLPTGAYVSDYPCFVNLTVRQKSYAESDFSRNVIERVYDSEGSLIGYDLTPTSRPFNPDHDHYVYIDAEEI